MTCLRWFNHIDTMLSSTSKLASYLCSSPANKLKSLRFIEVFTSSAPYGSTVTFLWLMCCSRREKFRSVSK
ncbi:hypothetical protein Plhal703r1_c13g0066211 [Plasmopara halstedii]